MSEARSPPSRIGTGSVKWEYEESTSGGGLRFEPAGDPEVIPMWVADMDFEAPECVADAIRRRAGHRVFGYTAPPPQLIEAISEWSAARHGFRPDPDWVVLTEGVVLDLGAVVRAFVPAGGGVIVHPPVYPPFFGAVRHGSARLVPCPLARDPAALPEEKPLPVRLRPLRPSRRRSGEPARDPLQSPTTRWGGCGPPPNLAVLASIARRRRLIVLSDEIHGDLMLDEQRFTPVALAPPRPIRRCRWWLRPRARPSISPGSSRRGW